MFASNQSKAVAFSLLSFAAMVFLMVWAPTLVAHAPDVSSASSAAGYNNAVAHAVAVGWIVATLAGAILLLPAGQPAPALQAATRPGRFRALLPLIALAGVAVLYFPPALALGGPHLEDSIHLTAMHRMLAGDVPYRDFEFLYGPLMLYPPYWWISQTSYWLTAYYSYVLLLEAAVFLLVLVPIQAHIRSFWGRAGAAAVMAALFFNAKLGPNQNGLRWIAGVLLLMSVARAPYRRSLWVVHGIGLGLFLGYSQEFASATAVGIAAIYLSLFVKMRDGRALLALFSIAAISAVTWLGAVWLVLGDALPDYFATLAYLTAQFNAGEAAFPYYWTLLGLSVFGILAMGLWSAARVLRADWRQVPGMGELLVLGGVGYALLALKSGLNRADQWHLAPAAYVLAFAFLLQLSTRLTDLRKERLIGTVLVTILAATYSFGQYGIARYVFREELGAGYRAYLHGVVPPAPRVEPVLPATIYQNAQPSPELVEISELLATPPYRGRPVFIYGELWNLGLRLGVRKMGYLADDFVYGDARAADAWRRLDATPDALVLVRADTFAWLKTPPGTPPAPVGFSLAGYGKIRALREMLTSVHIRAAPVERALKMERWKTRVGLNILATHHPVYQSDRFVILERNR